MLRICRQCATQYEGAPGSTRCPDCVAKNKKSTVRDRICRTCGITFPGGPRAWYCPGCRAERTREANRRHQRNGPARLLGSTDICTVCGGPYTVTGSRQRYCPNCAPEAIAAVDREQGRRWNAENQPANQRRAQRHAGAATIPCKVCSKLFIPTGAALTCSPECSMELTRQNRSAYEQQNRKNRNQYHKDRLAARIEAMTPEERGAYRQKVNTKARENYRKRKEKENKADDT